MNGLERQDQRRGALGRVRTAAENTRDHERLWSEVDRIQRAQDLHTLNIVFDGTPAAGDSADAFISFACSIVGWSIIALDAEGAVKIDIQRAEFDDLPPVSGDSICDTSLLDGSGQPTLGTYDEAGIVDTLAVAARGEDLTTWLDTEVIAGDDLRFVIDDVSGDMTRLTLALHLRKRVVA